jgi:hypothetical protein
MNNTSTRTEILEALDNVENVTMESSFDVMFTMADSYDKAAVILENYNGSDINSFAIFQEDGENNTAVQQGNASGNTNAEAKKESVFYKILMFIPRLLQQLGRFIAKTWNGVTTDVKEASSKGGLSEKVSSIFDKILGKDENWVKEHAVELGLSGAALTAAIALVGFFTRNKIGELFTAFVNSAKALSISFSTAPVFAWENGSFKTNLKFDGLKKTITDYIASVKKINELAKTLVTTENMSVADAKAKIKEAKSSLNLDNSPICGDEYYYYNVTNSEDGNKLISEVAGVVDALKAIDVEGSDKFDKPVKPNPELEKDSEIDKDVKELNQKNSLISKFLASGSKLLHGIWDWITNAFKKGEEIEDGLSDTASADTEQTPGTPETTGEPTGASDTASADTEQTPEGTATESEPELNQQYDLEQIKGWTTEVNDKNNKPKSIIPYNGHRFQWNKAANKYVYVESAEDDIDVDDSVVSEAATWYNRF